jgi:hypothetical protein
MAGIAAHPQESVFEAAALQVSLEHYLVGEGFALLGQLVDQRRVVRFDESVERCLLELMPCVGNVAKAMPINRGRLSVPCANMLCLGNQ